MADDRLTGKQLKFAVEYVKCFNATEAARRAGYAGNDATLAAVGYENLRKPHIVSFIDETFGKDIMSANEVLFHLTTIARGDMDNLVDDKGNPDIAKARQNGQTRLIKKIKTRTITTEDSDIVENELEVYSRQDALNVLAKYHNLINSSTVKVEDWRSQAIEDIRAGKLSYDSLSELFDQSLAKELFTLAGVPIAE